jgi:peptidoglycan/LPS O-acetylase OafA/YrhL
MSAIAANSAARVGHDYLAYRPFIDGLRAVSIIGVVGYHVGLPGFSGGYVGVDVFFVISGFLIINQIAAGVRAGTFSIVGFYARRALRILPPLLTVLLACIALAPLVLVTPVEMRDFGRAAMASALMFANQYFLDRLGYFDPVASLQPLLNTWTLSVEEQFYLVAPFALVGIAGFARLRKVSFDAVRLCATILLFLPSLIGCILLRVHHHNFAFFLMPLRGWEFIAGGAIPFAMPTSARLIRSSGMIAGLGLAAIVTAMTAYSSGMSYPFPWALLPTGGAVAVILAGLARPHNVVARLLAMPPLVGIGLVSYSWYLWHWPLLVFTRHWQFGEHYLGSGIAAGVISFLFAVATYVAIERPIRAWRRRIGPRRRWQVVEAGLLASGFCAFLGIGSSDLVAQRIVKGVPASLMASTLSWDIDPGDYCWIGARPVLDSRCLASPPGTRFGLLIGDSHALMMYRALRARASDQGARIIFLTAPVCPPLLPSTGADRDRTANGCIERNGAALQSIGKLLGNRLSFAIVSTNWLNYTRALMPNTTRDAMPDAMQRTGKDSEKDDQIHAFADELPRTMQRLGDMHVRRILLIGPVPTVPHDVPDCLIRADRRHLSRDDLCTYTRAYVDAQSARTVAMLQTMVRRFPNLHFVDPIGVLCDLAECRPYEGDAALYSDGSHLSLVGAEHLYGGFTAEFDWSFRGPD